MAILEALLQSLPAEPVPVRNVLVGVHWTAVSSRFCGLAASLRDEGRSAHRRVRDVGQLHLKSVQELAAWVLSENPLEASIGMAALNSLMDVDSVAGSARVVEINAAEVLAELGAGKNVAVVGHFAFVERLREWTQNCWVIEKQPQDGDYPAEAAADLLPQAEVVAITGTALTNHTVEELLRLCSPSATKMVLGPSTPLSPVLFDFGIHYLSGTRVIDEAQALLTIQQGAAFPQVQGVQLVTVERDKVQP